MCPFTPPPLISDKFFNLFIVNSHTEEEGIEKEV